MKYECGMIRDLMPLCADGIAAKESETAVQAHIAECAECAAEWAELQQGGAIYPETAVPEETKQYQQTAKRVRKRRRGTVIAAVCLTLVLAAGGIAKYLHVSGARLRPEDAALFDVHINSDIPAEKLSAVGSYEANTEKQIVFVLSEDTNNEYGAREFWCVENQRFAAFFGLWVSDGATMWPLRDIRMQHDITVPFSAYAGVLAVWSGNSDVERITLKMEDGNEHSADVNENGLCILTYDILDSGRVASGYAENERGERIYTLQKDSAAYDILRWEPVKKQDKS